MTKKTILITGATDGIGKDAAFRIAKLGHEVLPHGRSETKLKSLCAELEAITGANVLSFRADLSETKAVRSLVDEVKERAPKLDVLLNNAGVFATSKPKTEEGLDVRFAVNTIAPFMLTEGLSDHLHQEARIVNISSAAQARVDPSALFAAPRLSDGAAYAQSKLALMMWTNRLASLESGQRLYVSVNPASMLGTKMVKDAFGVNGGDIGVGGDILCRAAVSDEFAGKQGAYYDNDAKAFGPPHEDALDTQRCSEILESLRSGLARLAQ